MWKLSVPTLSHVRVAEASFQSLSFPIWIMGVGRERPGYGGTPFLVSGWCSGLKGLTAHQMTPRGLETPSSGGQPRPLQRRFLGRQPQGLQSLLLPPPSAGPLGLGRKRVRLDSPNCLVPTDSRARVERGPAGWGLAEAGRG